MNTELYDNICKADIQNSIYIATKILLTEKNENDYNFLILQNTMISICSYIGSFISLFDIRLWLDTIDSIISTIDEQQVDIKNIYVLITKLCILCQNYNKNPITKTGMLSVKLLREKVIDLFDINAKISDAGSTKFMNILPPHDSPSYNISIQIVTGYVKIMKDIDLLSADNDADRLNDISQKLRLSFDYIIRKKYAFETTFYENDTDAVWFLWGIISLLYDDNDINMIYRLFSFEYKKNIKKHRIGLLWGCALAIVFVAKRDISRNWNKDEVKMITKIYEVSIDLFKDIKKSIQEEKIEDIQNSVHNPDTTNHVYDGIDYIANYRPMLNVSQDRYEPSYDNENNSKNVKYIRYKK